MRLNLVMSSSILFMSLGLLPLPPALAASAPSFDCAKAKSSAEKAICADQELAKADAAIAASFIEVSKSLDSYVGEMLDKDQTYFLIVRDKLAEKAASPGQRVKVLKDTLAARLKFLDGIDTSSGDSLIGTWRNMEGEVVVERNGDGSLKASLNSAEQVNGNWVCDANGTAKAKGNILDFSVNDGQEGEKITLSRVDTLPMLGVDFVRSGRAEASPSFCGLNGSVVGFYFKMRNGK